MTKTYRKYHLTADAEDDVESISDYTFDMWGEPQMNRYLSGMKGTFDQIVDGSRFLSIRRITYKKKSYLYCYYGKHSIFFKYDGDIVRILRVLHQSMDAKRHLS